MALVEQEKSRHSMVEGETITQQVAAGQGPAQAPQPQAGIQAPQAPAQAGAPGLTEAPAPSHTTMWNQQLAQLRSNPEAINQAEAIAKAEGTISIDEALKRRVGVELGILKPDPKSPTQVQTLDKLLGSSFSSNQGLSPHVRHG